MTRRKPAEGWIGDGSLDHTSPSRHAIGEIARRPYDGDLDSLRKAFTEGNEGALCEAFALLLNREHLLRNLSPPAMRSARKIPVPIWMARAATSRLFKHLITGPPVRRGRTPTWLKRYREDMKHLARYEAVLWARESHRRGEDSFEKARQRLRGTGAYGSRDTIRYSFRKVKKSLDRGEQRFRNLAYLKSEELLPGGARGKK